MTRRSPRAQQRLWTEAAVVSAAPFVLSLVLRLFPGGSAAGIGVGIFPSGQCDGWRLHTELWSAPYYYDLQVRQWLIVLPAFVLWLVVRRRAVGWATLALLAPFYLPKPVLFGYDVARSGRTCVEMWLPFGAEQALWWCYDLVPLALILAATYRPGKALVRTGAALLVTAPLLAAAGDQDGPEPLSSPEACKGAELPFRPRGDISVQAVAGMSERERKLAYVCRMRGYGELYPGSMPLPHRNRTTDDRPSDTLLLDVGYRACRGERRMPHRPMRWPTFREYVYLCPETAAARQQETKHAQAKAHEEYERELAKVTAFCVRKAPDADIAPVREHTGVLTGGMTQAYQVGEPAEGASFDGYPTDDQLVVAHDGLVTVAAGTEDRLCMTVHAYRHEPPPELDGWDQIVEVGFDSPDGKTTIVQPDGPSEIPALTAAGPGRYRLRVHVTGRDDRDSWPLPAQHHLLVVFPRDSEEREVLKGPGS